MARTVRKNNAYSTVGKSIMSYTTRHADIARWKHKATKNRKTATRMVAMGKRPNQVSPSTLSQLVSRRSTRWGFPCVGILAIYHGKFTTRPTLVLESIQGQT